MKPKAVVLLSGGLDSSTMLAIAAKKFACYALTINYKQRNQPELQSAAKMAKQLGAKEHRIVYLEIGNWGGSALTDHSLEIPHEKSDHIPITYVPARNTIFLSVALAWAEVLEAQDIFLGAHIVDYSNYPDCRPEYLAAFEKMANLATRSAIEGKPFRIHAPLLQMNKTDIIKEGIRLGVDYSETLSCYGPTPLAEACGQCDPCRFRAQGFKEAGIPDVTRYAKEKA